MYRQKKMHRVLWITIALIVIFTSFIIHPVQAQTEIYEKLVLII